MIGRGTYVLGRGCADFETEFAAYCDTPHCVGNGTDVLELALRAVGVGEGDDVTAVANAGCYAIDESEKRRELILDNPSVGMHVPPMT